MAREWLWGEKKRRKLKVLLVEVGSESWKVLEHNRVQNWRHSSRRLEKKKDLKKA